MVRVCKVGREAEVSTFWLASIRAFTTVHRRAGIVPGSPAFESLLKDIHASSAISLYGFYCHAGNSYASTSPPQASSFLSSEVETVNEAAKLALDLIPNWSGGEGEHPRFVLSVGSTPTAHSASAETRAQLESRLFGILELHAGKLCRHRLPCHIMSCELTCHVRQLSHARSPAVEYRPH